MIRKYWITSEWATGQVNVDVDPEEGIIIISTPAVWGKFIGQPLGNLCNWLKKYSLEHLYEDKKDPQE
jgi:hypothetical protein